MKKAILYTTLALVFCLCTDKNEESKAKDEFKVVCRKNFKDSGTVKLFEIIAGNKKFVDSANFGSSDSVVFTGKLLIAGFYVLETAKDTYTLFPLDSEPITISIDGSLALPVFKASPTVLNDFFLKAETYKNNYNQVVDSMNQAYIFAENTQNKELVSKLENSIDTLTAALYYNLKREIYAHPFSIVSIHAANILGYDSEPALNDSLAQALEMYAPLSLYIQNYVESIKKLKKIQIGSLAPEFSQATPDGRKMGTKDFKGKVVLLDFWASWCIPCRKSNPDLVKMYEKYHDKGLEILGISLDENVNNWKEAIKADKLIWNHVSDLKSWDNEVAKLYNVQAIPFAYLLDKEGKIVAFSQESVKLEETIKELLK
jgi:peroxiredoxin